MRNAQYASTPGRGRTALVLGVACAVLGVAGYVAQLLAARRTETPWYAPALAVLGAGFIVLSLSRRRTVWRGLALVAVAALAGFEWWFLFNYARLPAYAGPVTVGQPFPEFRASRADGAAFTQADLPGDRATALVFFRGRW